VLQAFLA
jgi:hypothetical protein